MRREKLQWHQRSIHALKGLKKMNIDGGTILVHLVQRELLCVEVRHDLHIRCVEGSVWITHPGETADIVVEPGKGATFSQPGVAVLQALKPSKIALSASTLPLPARPSDWHPATRPA